ncbi:hypothetical protein N7468_009217 [Penicillium chermesinum]|uniref:DUF924-domain-containing protein n=1 Tax=Penicillium chermesinum TaxID=63820 RepID=A0A9W9NJY7_9EURO|nr:uncharacterized protein N7468_009217 [Penicillium chermesinum]KAJ5220013.1 hypothetical protein N7468_009217 [Penicillium chermesinum]KAJ6157470.1 hypothetical protein N7470_005062 [Penicillium chermesinum]
MQRTMSRKTYEDVLNLWFGAKSSKDYLQKKSFWYGSPKDDAFLRKTLGQEYQAAKDGEFDSWPTTGKGEGALALILLLDQVPRNIFRDTPAAYATDPKALSVARHAVTQGWDRELPAIQRRYMYSPFNHAENLEDQEMSVKLFTDLGDPYHLHWAKSHYDQIKKYGRFTHRDEILGRS